MKRIVVGRGDRSGGRRGIYINVRSKIAIDFLSQVVNFVSLAVLALLTPAEKQSPLFWIVSMCVDIFVCVSRLSRQYLKFFTGNKHETQSSQCSQQANTSFLSCLLHKSIHFCPVVAIPVYISGRKTKRIL